jgi:biofilm protein TabA
MILDLLNNSVHYQHLHPHFEKAFTYLRSENFETVSPGRYELEGDALFALVSDANGIPKAEAKLEVHRKYIDIQLIVNGTDHMGWKPLTHCEHVHSEYNEEKDFALFSDAAETWFDVRPGYFTVFFPTDAHAPMTTVNKVKKVVVKIAV